MKVSFAVSVIGIAGLLVVSQFAEAPQISISQLTLSMVGEKVVVNGIATGVSRNDGNLFMTLDDGTKIDVVVFERNARKIDVGEGANVTIIGTVNVYKSKLEIVADSII